MNSMRSILVGFGCVLMILTAIFCLDIIHTKTGIGRIGLTLPNDVLYLRFYFTNSRFPHQIEFGSHTNSSINFTHEF